MVVFEMRTSDRLNVYNSTSLDQFLWIYDNFAIPRVMIGALHATHVADVHWHTQPLRTTFNKHRNSHKHFSTMCIFSGEDYEIGFRSVWFQIACDFETFRVFLQIARDSRDREEYQRLPSTCDRTTEMKAASV